MVGNQQSTWVVYVWHKIFIAHPVERSVVRRYSEIGCPIFLTVSPCSRYKTLEFNTGSQSTVFRQHILPLKR